MQERRNLYRICKTFEIESGHFLSKHKEKCKNPHGHTRKIEVILKAPSLDENDMVCDFKAFKLGFSDFINQFDHAMLVNSSSPDFAFYQKHYERVIGTENVDPTTEVLAKIIFDFIELELKKEITYKSEKGNPYRFPKNVILERVRVWETSSTWAEYYLDR